MIKLLPRNVKEWSISPEGVQAAYEQAFNIAGQNWWQKLISRLAGIQSPFYFAEAGYEPVDEAVLSDILAKDTTDKQQYVTDWYDCDDFAFRLMGAFHQDKRAELWPIFITWVILPEGGHAVLSYYKDGEVKIIEPQNDQVFPVPEDWTLYLLCG